MPCKRYTVLFEQEKLDTFHKYVAPRKRSKLAPQRKIIWIFAGFPKCLKSSLVEGTLNGDGVQILMDAGSSKSYIDHRLLKELKVSVEEDSAAITMASNSHFLLVKTAVFVSLKVFSNN